MRREHGRAHPERLGVVACGALAAHVLAIANRRGWAVDVHPLPPTLHNHPNRISSAVSERLNELRHEYVHLAVAYAACGSNGELDRALSELGVNRLRGDTCYDVLGRDEVREALEEEPGTYFFTDFLVRTFQRTVVASLGLDRYPELRDVYFRHYTRAMWLAQCPTTRLFEQARAAAARLGLVLHIRSVGESGLERELENLYRGAFPVKTGA